jgi:hypothetical protein
LKEVATDKDIDKDTHMHMHMPIHFLYKSNAVAGYIYFIILTLINKINPHHTHRDQQASNHGNSRDPLL